MASYHFSVKVGSKGKATAHAAYIAREGKYENLRDHEILESKNQGNMPTWAQHDPNLFWQAADQYERSNGSTYREFEIALPRELTSEQRIELVNQFVDQELGNQHAYQWAIHNPLAALEGGEQPHAHIMFSERVIDGIDRDPEQYFKRYNSKDPEKGGAKKGNTAKTFTERKEELVQLRARWADLQNTHLEKYEHIDRVDHRSHKDRGITYAPERHLGWMAVMKPKAVQYVLDLRQETKQYRDNLKHLNDHIPHPTVEINHYQSLLHPTQITENTEPLKEKSTQHRTMDDIEQQLAIEHKVRDFLDSGSDDLFAKWDKELELEEKQRQRELEQEQEKQQNTDRRYDRSRDQDYEMDM